MADNTDVAVRDSVH